MVETKFLHNFLDGSSMEQTEKEMKRTRYDTYADLIRVIAHRGFCSLSRAARSANLPVDRAKTTIQYLCNRGVLVEKEENQRKGYKTTARGFTYLELYKQIRTLVGAPESSAPSVTFVATPGPLVHES